MMLSKLSGLHLRNRAAVRRNPFTMPCRSTAIREYWLHVGWNRQCPYLESRLEIYFL